MAFQVVSCVNKALGFHSLLGFFFFIFILFFYFFFLQSLLLQIDKQRKGKQQSL